MDSWQRLPVPSLEQTIQHLFTIYWLDPHQGNWEHFGFFLTLLSHWLTLWEGGKLALLNRARKLGNKQWAKWIQYPSWDFLSKYRLDCRGAHCACAGWPVLTPGVVNRKVERNGYFCCSRHLGNVRNTRTCQQSFWQFHWKVPNKTIILTQCVI